MNTRNGSATISKGISVHNDKKLVGLESLHAYTDPKEQGDL
ncbi:hypothetical protein [Metabacillus iocasae]|uniref:Uncharacterized protein n=1 Tax=Priestia iocasae TaxID=2291674 RepID=A0ABS2QSC6_9BACI|nr:hypothetical protein [Metabacillus iocasae]MBM7702329.1 hypothetical protein [Metabacillus iocasae]